MIQTKSVQGKGSAQASMFSRQGIFWWLPLLYLLISSAFYLRTYDSAQIKITLLQMGGTALLGLWLCQLIEEGWQRSFSGEDLACLAPFLAFLVSGILSFIHAPYHWSSLDLFLRRVFYMTIALILIKEFTKEAVERLIRMLIASTWIAVVYGVIQWIDFRLPGKGIDPFLWHAAFGDRLFSTYGNPNFFADYLVIMFPVVICQYFKKKQWSLLALVALVVFNIYGSQTKGAWIGLAISTVLLLGTYSILFQWEQLRRYKLRILATMFTIVMLTLSGVALKLRDSFTSINFRLFTWEATWEMIMTQPLAGTGIGSFWVIYPAFRRPPIFHIEGKHNTETDHVEDEYLEVLFDEGIVGFGIFLWLIASTFAVAYRALSQMTGGLKSGERAPPRAYDLMGFLIALQGMLVHNFFDVSMRFVSSGVYLGLLSGMAINLSRGRALSDANSGKESSQTGRPPFGTVPADNAWGEPLLWIARLAAFVGIAFSLWRLISQFAGLQMPVDQIRNNGEFLQWAIAWAGLLYCAGRLSYYFLRTIWATRNLLTPVIVLAMFPLLNLFWGFFQADVFQNMAIAYSRAQQWNAAIKSYTRVQELNPSYIMAFYFTGNVFNERLNMVKVYNPDWGDKDGIARDDFERALVSYDQVRSRSPNYVQTLHQLGNLYLKHGEWLMRQGQVEQGQKEWDQALHYYEMYHNIDPVFPWNYYGMARIYIQRGQHDKAIEAYQAHIEARECRVDSALLRNEWLRDTLLSYQSYVLRGNQWMHLHLEPQTYADLGGAYWMKGDVVHAERAFRDALDLDPNFGPARQNLLKLYDVLRAQNGGRMTPPAPQGAPSVPSFELIPSRH